MNNKILRNGFLNCGSNVDKYVDTNLLDNNDLWIIYRVVHILDIVLTWFGIDLSTEG